MIIKLLESDGSIAVGTSRQDSRKHLEAEQIKWRKVLQDTVSTLSTTKLK